MSDETHTEQTLNSEPVLNDAEDSVLVTQSLLSRSKDTDWTTRRALVIGAVFGALFGVVFFAGYAGTSAWICSARLDCGHWAPIAIVSTAGAIAFTLIGAAIGFALNRIYRAFRVV